MRGRKGEEEKGRTIRIIGLNRIIPLLGGARGGLN